MVIVVVLLASGVFGGGGSEGSEIDRVESSLATAVHDQVSGAPEVEFDCTEAGTGFTCEDTVTGPGSVSVSSQGGSDYTFSGAPAAPTRAPAAASPPSKPRSRRPCVYRHLVGGGRIRTALWAGTLGLVLADSSIVTLALPEMLRRFETTVLGVSWVLTAFNIVLALAVLPAARLAAGRGARGAATAWAPAWSGSRSRRSSARSRRRSPS